MTTDIIRASDAPLFIESLLMNMCSGFLLATVLRWHFRPSSLTLSHRGEFSEVFPLVLLTTALNNTILKSLLALSFGLVGVLSKEYLFELAGTRNSY